MNIQDILKDELNKISLSIEDVSKLRNISNDFVKLLKTKKVHARIGGSLAKGTLIKKDSKQDVDIFVIFDYSEDISKLEKILKNLKLPGTLKKVHGSRDYFQINCKDAILEIIPVIKNSDPELAENVTDVSLSHVKYIGAEVKKNPSIADEIKLAKAFCRANRYYGAESYIHGFSGYSLEILVIYFGSFVKFLKARIDRNKFSGLHLTYLVIALLYVLSLLAGVIEDIVNIDPITQADIRFANLFYIFRSDLLVDIFLWITALGKWQVIFTKALLVSALLWLWRKRVFILPFWLALLGTEAFVWLGKMVFHRARPPMGVYIESSFSFPSAHAAIAVHDHRASRIAQAPQLKCLVRDRNCIVKFQGKAHDQVKYSSPHSPRQKGFECPCQLRTERVRYQDPSQDLGG